MKPRGRGAPREDEIARVLDDMARRAIRRWHVGCPPQEVDYDYQSFIQEITTGALPRVRNFRYVGKYTLEQFTWMACCYALRDIQRVAVRRWKQAKGGG